MDAVPGGLDVRDLPCRPAQLPSFTFLEFEDTTVSEDEVAGATPRQGSVTRTNKKREKGGEERGRFPDNLTVIRYWLNFTFFYRDERGRRLDGQPESAPPSLLMVW